MKFVQELIRPGLPCRVGRHTEAKVDRWGHLVGMSPRILKAVYEKDETGNCKTVGLWDVTDDFPYGNKRISKATRA